jgi:ABC-type transporter Mla subunit MlaD
MSAFVEQLTLAISHSQETAQAKLQHTLDDIANHMAAVIQSMGSQIQAASEAGRQYQSGLAQEGRKVVGEFSKQVDLLVEGVMRAVDEMKTAVNAMRHVTGTTVSQMNAGADMLYAASKAFAETGRDMTDTLGKTSDLLTRFGQVSGSITGASDELGKVLADYQAARDTMTAFLESLRIAAEQSRRETTFTGDVLVLLENATDKLVSAQKEADSYLARVSEVIENAHNTFTSSMARAVDGANQDFQRALSDSVSLLRIGIQELGTTLEELGTVRQSLSGKTWLGTNR